MADTVNLSLFEHSWDNYPKGMSARLDDLAHLVAPEHPEVRGDLYYTCQAELRAIEQAHGAFVVGEPPTPPLHRWHGLIAAAAKSIETGGGSWDAQLQAAQLEMERLKRGRRQAAKSRLPAWCPARFRAGGRRCKADVIDVSCLVLDYDDGPGMDPALAPWADVTVLVATSWSHTEAHPKFRLILPLAEPVPADQWDRVWRWAHDRSGALADKACSDASRMYYLPARPHAWAPYESRRVRLDGPLLHVRVEAPPGGARARPAPPSRPVAAVPTSRLRRVAQERLKHDVSTRHRAAAHLGASICGDGPDQRAEDIACPHCGRPSVWFYIAPRKQVTASCQHRESCGWWGFLDQLLEPQGVDHD